MKYCARNIYYIIQNFLKFASFITQIKYMILKNLSFIQNCNFNLPDFFETKDFYDLVLLKKRPQNHKNKNVEEKSLVCPRQMLTPKSSLPPLRPKNINSIPRSSFSPRERREDNIATFEGKHLIYISYIIYNHTHSVHWGIDPPQKHQPPLSCQASP